MLQVWLNKMIVPLGAARLAVCCCAAPCVVACGGPESNQVVVDVDSWWKLGSETSAFDSILTKFHDDHPGAIAENAAKETDAAAARKTLTARLLAKAPPSSFQANIGADVLQWSVVETEDGATSSRISGLHGFFAANDLYKRLPQPLIDALVAGPTHEPYTVPVDIHRLNTLYYNTQRLAEFSARHAGASFLDREVLCPPDVAQRLHDGSRLDVTIAVGTADTFVLTLFAFENMLPAVGDAALYDDVFRGRASGNWRAQVRTALQCVQYLSRSFMAVRSDNWAGALKLVEQQSDGADFSVMGDWSNGELADPLLRGTVVGVPFPGSEDTYVFTSDTFPLPIGAPYTDQTQELLGTMVEESAQLDFSAKKGSIPALSGLDLRLLPPYAAAARDAFDSPNVTKVLATSGLFPPYYPGDKMTDLLLDMIASDAGAEEIENVLDLLRDIQPMLAHWQRQVAGESANDP